MKKKGFTLIEVTVVMAIIAVLSVMIIIAIQGATRARRETQNRNNARVIEVGMEAHAARHQGRYCGAAPMVACSATATIQAHSNALRTAGFLAAAVTSPCANGGGQFTVMNANTFTIQVANWNCLVGATAIDTITH